MKDLFLIRHGKSSWTDDSLTDIDRPLNKRGKQQVQAMSAPFLESGALDGLIYASHAYRARQTIEGVMEQLPERHLASQVRFDPALYTFRYKFLLKWIRQLNSDSPSLTLIGHNPALSDLARALIGEDAPDLVTGAVLHLKLAINRWDQLGKGQGTLEKYLPPANANYPLFQRKAPKAPTAHQELQKQVPAVLQHQLQTLRALQPGVIQGADPEFLHQFRVNLRRSRAVTEAVVTITGADSLRKTVKPLKRMARHTSQLRDLDVFLEYLKKQGADNPRVRRSLQASGALEFFHHWRDREQQALVRVLQTKSWRKDLEKWEAALSGKPLGKALKKTTATAIHDTVRQRGEACRFMFDELSFKSPDDDFHDLRKTLKRLRYLAELDKPYYRTLRRELKDQQARYGEFQDRHQQQILLAALADSRLDRRLPPVLAELAIQIEREKRVARDAILAHPPKTDED